MSPDSGVCVTQMLVFVIPSSLFGHRGNYFFFIMFFNFAIALTFNLLAFERSLVFKTTKSTYEVLNHSHRKFCLIASLKYFIFFININTFMFGDIKSSLQSIGVLIVCVCSICNYRLSSIVKICMSMTFGPYFFTLYEGKQPY